jgi:hypothetical protein
MLTIQNINKILHKTLGKKNFYVARVEEQFSIDNIAYNASQHQYKFELSNRKYAITIILDRISSELHNENYYRLQSSTGHTYYVTSKQISNIDIFIDKLRFVAFN